MVSYSLSHLVKTNNKTKVNKINNRFADTEINFFGMNFSKEDMLETSKKDRHYVYNSVYDWKHSIKTHRKKLPTCLDTSTRDMDIKSLDVEMSLLNNESNRINKIITPESSSKYDYTKLTKKISGNRETIKRSTHINICVNKSQSTELSRIAKYQRLCYNMMSKVQWSDEKFKKSKGLMGANTLQNKTLQKGTFKKTSQFKGHTKLVNLIKNSMLSACYDSVSELVVGNYKSIISRHGKQKEFRRPTMLKNKDTDIITMTSRGYRIRVSEGKNKSAYFRIMPSHFAAKNISFVFHGKTQKDKDLMQRLLDDYESDDNNESSRNRPSIKIIRKYNDWCIKFPEDVFTCENIARNVCAFDPGMRKLFTVIDDDKHGYTLGNCVQKNISRAMKRINNIGLKVKNGLITKRHGSVIEKNRVIKMDNFTDDYYKKLSRYMAINHRAIIAPEIGNFLAHTRYGNTNKLHQRLILHSKFSKILSETCEKFKCNYLYTKEYKTSMTCSHCGNEDKNLGSSETYNCKKCGITLDRDLNGARNIFMRYLGLE